MLSIIELEADEIDIAEKQLESASNNGQFRYKSKAGSNRGGGGGETAPGCTADDSRPNVVSILANIQYCFYGGSPYFARLHAVLAFGRLLIKACKAW